MRTCRVTVSTLLVLVSAFHVRADHFQVFPVESVQQNSIEVNKIRYRLFNLTFVEVANDTGSHEDFSVEGIAKTWPDRMSLLHPNFVTYWIHTFFQVLAAIMALKCPRVLLGLLIAAVLCWPISLIFNQNIWAMEPLSSEWILFAVKSVIVNICPTVPMMLCLILKPRREICQRAAIWTYFILWANVAWTLCFLPLQDFNTVACCNAICGVSLCTSLVIHLVALCRKGVVLFEVHGDIIYGYGTSLSWLVCYTVWNAIFVTELAIGLSLQDIAFWAMMIFFYYWSKGFSSVENFFAMARPISLSMYIATSDWPGLFDFFRQADPLGLDTKRHAYILYLASANVLYSFYVLFWEICLLAGCCGAKDYYDKTFKYQNIYAEASEEESEDDEE